MTANLTIRELWREDPARIHFGICDDCNQAARVAKQPHAQKFQCVECFATRPSGSRLLQQRVRDAARLAKRASQPLGQRLGRQAA